MRSIGIRELRQRASEYLRLVEAGEVLQVTDRGRLIAVISPVPTGDELEVLRRMGEVSIPVAPINDLPDPIRVDRGQELPSAVLSRLRADER